MSMATDYVWFIVATILLLVYLLGQRKPKNFPPGPWGFPVLGHLPLLGLEPYKTVMNWKSKYGPIVGIDFASFPCVFISDYKFAKEALADPVYNSRPNLNFCTKRCGGGIPEGIIFSSGRTWREQRQFTHKKLRELGGFGTKSKVMESAILKQVDELNLLLKKQTNVPITTHNLFNVAVVNSLWSIVAGEPFQQTDPIAIKAARCVVEGFQEASLWSQLAMFMPWLNDRAPDWVTGAKGVEKQWVPILEFLRPYIEQHWSTHKEGEPRDLIDSFIDEIKACKDKDSSFHSSRAKYSLETTLLDLFLAGTETVGTTLSWICIYLVNYPEIQAKLAKQIESVCGLGKNSRSPSLADRKDLPFVEAIIHEVQRLRPLVPMGVFHNTIEPTKFHGYNIPKETMVFINIWEAHYNEEFWGDPNIFRPQRWINDNSGEFEKKDAFLVYSTGKRVCLGEQMGRDETFLFTIGLIQKFVIEKDPSGGMPNLDPEVGGTTLGPKEHVVVFKKRD